MSKSISIIIIGSVVIIAGYFFLSDTEPTELQTQTIQTPQFQMEESEQMVMMGAGDFFFQPKKIKVKLGELVTIHIDAIGEHTFTIDELGVNVPTPHGKTTAVVFTPNKKGTFQFYCAIGGHRGAGQVGIITVE